MGYLLRELAGLPDDERLELTEVWVHIDADDTVSLVFSRDNPFRECHVSGSDLKRFGLSERKLKTPKMTPQRCHPAPDVTKILLDHTREINALFE